VRREEVWILRSSSFEAGRKGSRGRQKSLVLIEARNSVRLKLPPAAYIEFFIEIRYFPSIKLYGQFFGESQSCPPSVESSIAFIYGFDALLLVGLAVAPHSDLSWNRGVQPSQSSSQRSLMNSQLGST
jgi:hypothetical protein